MDNEMEKLLILGLAFLFGILVMTIGNTPCSDNEHKCGTPFAGDKITNVIE